MTSVDAGAGVGRMLRLLRLAATLEHGSEHPLAAAIVQGAMKRGVHRFARAERV